MIQHNLRRGAKLLFGWIAPLTFLAASTAVFADEVSLVKGFYRSQNVKDSYDTSIISGGARYLLTPPKGQDFALFFEGSLALNSYSGTGAPSNDTSIDIFAGVRKYLTNIGESVQPYVAVYGGYANENSGDSRTGTHVAISGLVYKGAVGLKLSSHDGFFIDLETSLFNSSLFATEKRTTGNTEIDITHKDLYIDTAGAFNTTTIGLGMKI